jgi:acyl-CoA thioester hydrolase
MFSVVIQPRFVETDALGHINNTVLPQWFEQARSPIFKLFVPSMNPAEWNLILAKIEVEFVSELFYPDDVELRSYVERLGNSSCVVYQEVWQGGKLGAKGRATLVHFDHQSKKAIPIPEPIRTQLAAHPYEA